MSRNNRTNNKHNDYGWSVDIFGDGNHAQLREELFYSVAFKSLDPQSRYALLRLFMEYKGDSYTKNHTVKCTYKNFKDIGISNPKKCITELEVFGFVKITYSNIRKVPNEYRFIGKWRSVKEDQVETLKAEVKAIMQGNSNEWKQSHVNYEYTPTLNQRMRHRSTHK